MFLIRLYPFKKTLIGHMDQRSLVGAARLHSFHMSESEDRQPQRRLAFFPVDVGFRVQGSGFRVQEIHAVIGELLRLSIKGLCGY